jgi:hypothetical protein
MYNYYHKPFFQFYWYLYDKEIMDNNMFYYISINKKLKNEGFYGYFIKYLF